MSRDKSLKTKGSLERHRNVLTRAERVAKLQEVGRWAEDDSVLGMPKVAHRKASVGKKTKAKKTVEPGAEGEVKEEEQKTES